jgi:hypothetical protein
MGGRGNIGCLTSMASFDGSLWLSSECSISSSRPSLSGDSSSRPIALVSQN